MCSMSREMISMNFNVEKNNSNIDEFDFNASVEEVNIDEMNENQNEPFEKEVRGELFIGHNVKMKRKEVLGLENCKINSREEVKGNSDSPKFWQEFETGFKILTTLVSAKSFITCDIMLYSHSGWRRLIIGLTVEFMYLMKKYKWNFDMVSRCMASCDGKKKCNKWSEIGSKVEFDGVNEFASNFVDELG